MEDDLICCNPRHDRVLAITEIMPFEPEEPRKTAKEKQDAREKVIASIKNYKKVKLTMYK